LRHRPEWKRFTIDVPVELHRRIKMASASRDLEMGAWMRKLLETNVARLENSSPK
jgi:predicted HicB family RNase H-like nuclease